MSGRNYQAICARCARRRWIAAFRLCEACYQRQRRAAPREYWSAQLAQYFASPEQRPAVLA